MGMSMPPQLPPHELSHDPQVSGMLDMRNLEQPQSLVNGHIGGVFKPYSNTMDMSSSHEITLPSVPDDIDVKPLI